MYLVEISQFSAELKLLPVWKTNGRHIGFVLPVSILTIRSSSECLSAYVFQISSKSDYRGPSYDVICIFFRMAAVRQFRFSIRCDRPPTKCLWWVVLTWPESFVLIRFTVSEIIVVDIAYCGWNLPIHVCACAISRWIYFRSRNQSYIRGGQVAYSTSNFQSRSFTKGTFSLRVGTRSVKAHFEPKSVKICPQNRRFAPKTFWGKTGSKCNYLLSGPQKAHPCAKRRRLTYWASKSVNVSIGGS